MATVRSMVIHPLNFGSLSTEIRAVGYSTAILLA
nr:MAG TPA: hypothetical protein [Microviridae sp.]